MVHKIRVSEINEEQVTIGSKIIKNFSLMLAISFIVIGCDSVVDQNINDDNSLSMSDTVEAYSVDTTQSACINPDNPEYSKKTDSNTIEWGNRRNPSNKTVDILYYNTLEQLVLKVKSSHNIADVLVDDESIKNFNGSVSPNAWQEFTFELEPDWEAGDTWSFEVKVTGFGPQVYFNVDYTLLGECEDDWPRDTSTIVVDVTNPATGRTWMDRNLGASRAAISPTDSEAYGDLYQWGRAADGHEKRSSSTTTTTSNTDTPEHSSFIIRSSDWRSPRNDNLWQGVNGINNPCPVGYRLPTYSEWEAERQSWSSNNAAGAYASPLKLPDANFRIDIDGTITDLDSYGNYWSSTVSTLFSFYLYFSSSNAGKFDDTRTTGVSVRCIKD